MVEETIRIASTSVWNGTYHNLKLLYGWANYFFVEMAEKCDRVGSAIYEKISNNFYITSSSSFI